MYSDGDRVVEQVGKPTAGGAHAKYRTAPVNGGQAHELALQHDTIPKVGVVGWTNECLLAVVLDRLTAFQAGPFPSIENEIAVGAVRAALVALEYRTKLRRQRDVEGTHAE